MNLIMHTGLKPPAALHHPQSKGHAPEPGVATPSSPRWLSSDPLHVSPPGATCCSDFMLCPGPGPLHREASQTFPARLYLCLNCSSGHRSICSPKWVRCLLRTPSAPLCPCHGHTVMASVSPDTLETTWSPRPGAYLLPLHL